MELQVDGVPVSVPEGATILEACDLAGRYVPRLCSYPGIGCACELGTSCGLCAVEVDRGGVGGGRGSVRVLACSTAAQPGMAVGTSSRDLVTERLARLAVILERHPHVCLTCPDRDGCIRQECTLGIPAEARCCTEFGRCELGKLVAHVDAGVELPRRAVAVSREFREEARIRREPGLCVGCGRCVVVCGSSDAAGGALRLEDPGDAAARGSAERRRAVPKKESLRVSGCTFCGQCVMVCPTGAVTAPGAAGARWLESRRKRTGLALPTLPPESGWRPLNGDELARVRAIPGVFELADTAGRVLRIGGVADLGRGLAAAVAEPACRSAARFRLEEAELFTQRESELLARFAQEHGHLPPGNDWGDALFADDLLDDDLE